MTSLLSSGDSNSNLFKSKVHVPNPFIKEALLNTLKLKKKTQMKQYNPDSLWIKNPPCSSSSYLNLWVTDNTVFSVG